MEPKLKDLRFRFLGDINITPDLLLRDPIFRFEGLTYKFSEGILYVQIAFKESEGIFEHVVVFSFEPANEQASRQDFLNLLENDPVLSQFELV